MGEPGREAAGDELSEAAGDISRLGGIEGGSEPMADGGGDGAGYNSGHAASRASGDARLDDGGQIETSGRQ